MPTLWLNGALAEEDAARIPPRDAGLLHGVGVFTTLRATAGKLFRLEQHLARLRDDAAAMQIPLPYEDAELAAAVRQVLEASDLSDARLRLTVTAGTPAGQGQQVPTCMLTAAAVGDEMAAMRETGTSAVLLSDWKLNPYDPQAGHKTLDYASRLAALRKAASRGCGEALWFSVHNFLQSGSVSNVFVVTDAALHTPPTQTDLAEPLVADAAPYTRSNALPGITRHAILELATNHDVEVSRGPIDVNLLLSADEVFVTNSMVGVLPVTKLEAEPVGDGEPGPVTRQLTEALQTLMSNEGSGAS